MGSFSGGSTGLTINSTQPISPNAGELWIDNSSDSVYVRNSTNDGWITITPIGNTVESYDTTIGNYTTPTTVTSSSDATSSSTYPTSASGSGGYNGYANIANSYDGNDATDVSNALVYRTDIPSWLTSTATWDWGSSQTGNLRILYKEYRATEANSNFQYSTDNASWTTLLNTNTGADNVNVDYLSSSITWRYVRVNRSITSGTYNNNYGLSVYEISKYIPSTPNLYDDNTTTISKTTAEANPSFTADLGSSLVCTHYAIYMEADTDETEFDLEYSTDNITYTKIRTLPKTKLINGQWNYVRFNPVTARYIKIKGNSGSAKTLSATQIKIKTNANLPNSHGHNTISATDNTLALSG